MAILNGYLRLITNEEGPLWERSSASGFLIELIIVVVLIPTQRKKEPELLFIGNKCFEIHSGNFDSLVMISPELPPGFFMRFDR